MCTAVCRSVQQLCVLCTELCVQLICVLLYVGVYNSCVYKFDHYCVWIGNCVGGLNHRYFVALLTSVSAMCIHGVWGIVKVLTAIITVYQISTTETVHLMKVIQTR